MQPKSAKISGERRNNLNPKKYALIARSMIRARRALHGLLPSELIHDAALELLLHMYIAKGDGLTLTLDELQVASTVPSHSVNRWITALRSYGLVGDALRLSEAGLQRMTETLDAVDRSQS